MNPIAAQSLKLVLGGLIGAVLAATVWLWLQFGASIYFTRLMDFAWTCF